MLVVSWLVELCGVAMFRQVSRFWVLGLGLGP